MSSSPGNTVQPASRSTTRELAQSLGLSFVDDLSARVASPEFVEKLAPDGLAEELKPLHGRDDLLGIATRAPVVKLVNLLLFEAAQARASDLHLQPYEHQLVVRMRIDGVLHNAFRLPKAMQEE